jgi:hypothetical protein
LIDPSVAPPGPTLPLGHPFQNVQSASYWSATTIAETPTNAWNVFFNGEGRAQHQKGPQQPVLVCAWSDECGHILRMLKFCRVFLV